MMRRIEVELSVVIFKLIFIKKISYDHQFFMYLCMSMSYYLL